MLRPNWTEEDLAEQALQYGGNRYRTCRGIPIQIEGLRLSDAFDRLEQAQYQLESARKVESDTLTNKAYSEAKLTTVLRENERDDAKSQVEAVFYRETGRHLHSLQRLGL